MNATPIWLFDSPFINDFDFIFSDAPDLTFKIKKVDLPFQKLTHIKKDTGQKYYKDVEFVDTFTIEIYETTDFRTSTYFQIWMDLVYDSKTKCFMLYPPVKTATLILNNYFRPTGTKRFFYNNIKLLGFEPVTFSTENGNPLTYNVTFAVEEILPV